MQGILGKITKEIDGVQVTTPACGCGPQAVADCKDEPDPCAKAIELLKADKVNLEEQWQVKPYEKPPAPKIEACAEIDCEAEDIPLDETAYEAAW